MNEWPIMARACAFHERRIGSKAVTSETVQSQATLTDQIATIHSTIRPAIRPTIITIDVACHGYATRKFRDIGEGLYNVKCARCEMRDGFAK